MKTWIILLIVLLVFGSLIGCKDRRNPDAILIEYGIDPPGKGDDGGGEGGGNQQPVPEPCTLLLVGGGLVIIGLRKRMKK